MKTRLLGVAGLALLTAACGSTDEQRAATGGLSGAAVGALVGGPVGALAGAAVGGVGGTVLDEGVVDKVAEWTGDADATAQSGSSMPPSSADARSDRADIRRVQERLAGLGLYEGEIDGIIGPKTEAALLEYSQRQLSNTTRRDNQIATTGSDGTRVSRLEAKKEMQQAGFVGITDVERQNGIYTAQALRDTRLFTLQLDPKTGQILSARQIGGFPEQTALSGGSAMTREQIRQDVSNEGFSQLSGLRRDGNAYWLRGVKDGASYDIQVNAQTGRIVSANRVGGKTSGMGSSSTEGGRSNR